MKIEDLMRTLITFPVNEIKREVGQTDIFWYLGSGTALLNHSSTGELNSVPKALYTNY